MARPPRLTIVFDNHPGGGGLATLWGFAALLETGEQTILFDTGSNGRVLLQNMAGLRPAVQSQVDLVFLSHPHWDHLGGLDSVLELNPDATVVVHEGFSAHLRQDLRLLCRDVVVVGPEPQQLAPGIFSTGVLDGSSPEQALLLDSGEVTALISGCAHPGVERLVERGVATLDKPIRWVVGGFHLLHADDGQTTQCARALQELGVTDVVPTHCSGDAARAAFARAYGARCRAGGVGRVLALTA